MQIESEINSYWNKSAEGYNQFYSSKTIKNEIKQEKWQSLYCNEFPSDAKMILDVGTGPGIIAIMLAQKGFNVTAVDFSDDMLKFARDNAHNKNQDIEFKIADAESLPFDDNSFDVVVSRHMLWTTVNPEVVFKEWFRILKPGGKIVYIDGNWYKTDKTLKRKLWIGFSEFITLVTEFRDPRSEDLSEEMKKALWSVKANRPEYDKKILNDTGYINITTKDSIESEVFSWKDYLKEGYWGPRFLVSAEKP